MVRRLLRAVARFFRRIFGKPEPEPGRTFRLNPRKLSKYLEWQVEQAGRWKEGKPANLWVPSDKLELLKDIASHRGWQVFKDLVELRLDWETVQLAKIQPQDQTNYRRGIIAAYTTVFEMVDKTLEDVENYHARQRKLDARATAKGPNLAARWGSPHWYDEFVGSTE